MSLNAQHAKSAGPMIKTSVI